MSWSVFDAYGGRKYLNRLEIRALLKSTEQTTKHIHAFCWLLSETGCRISEALATTPRHIDMSGPTIIFECLKKRRKGVFRAIPISFGLAYLLISISGSDPSRKIWPWARNTAWRHLNRQFQELGIVGPQACPRGLRHGFAVAALGAGAPLNLVQIWLGHANIATTSVYALAMGPEEREIAERVWQRLHDEKPPPPHPVHFAPAHRAAPALSPTTPSRMAKLRI